MNEDLIIQNILLVPTHFEIEYEKCLIIKKTNFGIRPMHFTSKLST